MPCDSEKDKKYLLMELTKLVLPPQRGGKCLGMDPSLRFAAQLAFLPRVEGVVTEIQDAVG